MLLHPNSGAFQQTFGATVCVSELFSFVMWLMLLSIVRCWLLQFTLNKTVNGKLTINMHNICTWVAKYNWRLPEPNPWVMMYFLWQYRHWYLRAYLMWHIAFFRSYLIQILEFVVQKYYIYEVKLLIWYEWKNKCKNATSETDMTGPAAVKMYHSVGFCENAETLSLLAIVQQCNRVEHLPSQTIFVCRDTGYREQLKNFSGVYEGS